MDPVARFSYEQLCGNVRLDLVVQCNGEKITVEIKNTKSKLEGLIASYGLKAMLL